MTGGHNIAAHLPRIAETHPDTLSVAVQHAGRGDAVTYEEWTLAQLDRESNRIASGLLAIGLERGMRVVLMVTPSLDFFALTFGLFKLGAVPVMVDPGMGVRNLRTCIDEAQPQAFIGIPKAHVARLLFGWGKKTARIKVTVGRKLFWGGTTIEKVRSKGSETFETAAVEPEETAAILFTSGNTGVPKGAVYSHAIFNAQVNSLREDYGIEPGERDLATFPLFALFGPALGMAAIVPDMDASRPITADPARLVAAAQKYEATNVFASPALLDKLGRHCETKGVTLPHVRRVISAGAPAEPPSLRRFATVLNDGVEVIPSYGATEALPIANIGSRELLEETAALTEQGRGVCVGRPCKGITVRVIHITDTPIAEWSNDIVCEPGEIGEICVSGPVVTRAYFERPDATRLAKIPDAAGATFYHRMGDVGYLDEQGRLWMCGRKSHRVMTPNGTLFTVPCERILNTHPKVRRTALVGVTVDGVTEPLVCVELDRGEGSVDEKSVIKDLRELAASNEVTKPLHRFLVHPKFPVDIRHNAKIHAEKLAEWAQQRVASSGETA